MSNTLALNMTFDKKLLNLLLRGFSKTYKNTRTEVAWNATNSTLPKCSTALRISNTAVCTPISKNHQIKFKTNSQINYQHIPVGYLAL